MKRSLTREEADWLRVGGGRLRLRALGRRVPGTAVVRFFSACGHVFETDYARTLPKHLRITAQGLATFTRNDRWWVGQGVSAHCPACGHGRYNTKKPGPYREVGTRRLGTWTIENEQDDQEGGEP